MPGPGAAPEWPQLDPSGQWQWVVSSYGAVDLAQSPPTFTTI